MNLEHYAIHIAPRGLKIDLVVDDIFAKREAALDARWAYAKSKGAVGLYQNESHVSGLIFASAAPLPEGWAKIDVCAEGIIAEPKAKDRTKVERAAHLARKTELSNLPRLSGADKFTKAIGGNMVMGTSDSGRGFCLRNCFFERVGETTFVFTPWCTKQQETGNLADDCKTMFAFEPEGCKRVGLSAYYAAKESIKPAAVVAA